LQDKHAMLGDVRGMGLMIGLELVANRETREPAPKARERVIQRAFEKGLLTLPCGKSTVRLSPPLVCTDSDADKAVSILDEVLAEVSATS
jgi:4-aminobutyrate aminotransferase